MTSRLSLSLAAVLLSLLAAAPTVSHAGGSCGVNGTLERGTVLRFDASGAPRPRLQATLARDLLVPVLPHVLQLKAGDPEEGMKRPVVLRNVPLDAAAMEDGEASLSFDHDASGFAWVSVDGRRYQLQLRQGKAYDGNGDALRVVPDLVDPVNATLEPGARVTPRTDGIVIARGAKLSWSPESVPLRAALARDARLTETGKDTPRLRLDIMRPPRVLPGGEMKVQVISPDFDFRSKRFVVCFAPAGADGPGVFRPAADAKIESQRDDVATLTVRLPDMDKHRLPAEGDGTPLASWGRAFGEPLVVRVLGYDDDRLVLDATREFRLSGRAIAIVVLLGFVGLLTVLGIIFMRRAGPLHFLGQLITIPPGRYSLSHTQILAWTLLVAFALTFVWAANGELLSITPGFLVLLGISGSTSVLAKTLDHAKTDKPSPVLRSTPRLRDLVTVYDEKRKEEVFDLLRFQMLVFTLFTWLYSLVSVLRSEGLPEIPENLYTLMGISSAAYVGGKLPGVMNPPRPADQDGGTPAGNSGGGGGGAGGGGQVGQTHQAGQGGQVGQSGADATAGKARVKLSGEDFKLLQTGLGLPATGTMDARTAEAVIAFKRQRGIIPANADVGARLLEAVRNG